MDSPAATTPSSDHLVELAADIVSAYVTKNSVRTTDLPELITSVHAALKNAQPSAQPEPVKAEPAISIRKSVTPDYIYSLFDGKRYKSLKRHLRTGHNMTPEQYRAHWGLSSDYPMVAPNYAKARSDLAKSIGLGQKGPAARKKAGKGKKAS